MEHSIIAFLRWSEQKREFLLFGCNFTPVPREGYRFGVPKPGWYKEIFNTDSEWFGGSNYGNGLEWIQTDPIPFHGHPQSLCIKLPPLGVTVFKLQRETEPALSELPALP